MGIDLDCDLYLCPAVDALLGGDAVAGILASGMEKSDNAASIGLIPKELMDTLSSHSNFNDEYFDGMMFD